LAGATVVVHAAAETSGDFAPPAEHDRRDAPSAARDARCGRLPAGARQQPLGPATPRTPWERQDERTPRPANSARFGPYSWGKTEQEALVEREAPALGITVRVVRPGALVDWSDPSLPGLMGRHLFGRWHLGLGGAAADCRVRCRPLRGRNRVVRDALRRGAAGREPVRSGCGDARSIRGASARPGLDRPDRVDADQRAGGGDCHGARDAVGCARPVAVAFAAWSILRPRRYDDRITTKVLASCR